MESSESILSDAGEANRLRAESCLARTRQRSFGKLINSCFRDGVGTAYRHIPTVDLNYVASSFKCAGKEAEAVGRGTSRERDVPAMPTWQPVITLPKHTTATKVQYSRA